MKRGGWVVLLLLAVALYVLYVKFGGVVLSGPQSADLGEPQNASYYSNIYYSPQNNPTANRRGTKGPIAESLFSTKN